MPSSAPGGPNGLAGTLPGATWAPRELSGNSLGPPQNHEKPMKSLRKTRFSEKLTPERFPRAQAAPGSPFGSLGTPRPPPPHPPLYLLEPTISLRVTNYASFRSTVTP